MKYASYTKYLPLGVLGTGLLAALLRLWLYASGIDEKGLLIPGHPANILIWLLTAAVIAALFFFCRFLKEANKFRYNFPASQSSAAGCLAAALGVFVDAMGHLGGDALQNVTGFLGIFSAAALVFIGFCRLKGRYPSVLFNGLICLYLMLTLVGLYRTWSAEPQLQNYVFPLLGCVAVMLACYHDAAFAAHAGSRRKHTFFHMLAVYLCLASLPQNDSSLFYLSLAAWMLTGHCNLTPASPASRRARPELAVTEPETSEDGPAEAALETEGAVTIEDGFAALEAETLPAESVTMEQLSFDLDTSTEDKV